MVRHRIRVLAGALLGFAVLASAGSESVRAAGAAMDGTMVRLAASVAATVKAATPPDGAATSAGRWAESDNAEEDRRPRRARSLVTRRTSRNSSGSRRPSRRPRPRAPGSSGPQAGDRRAGSPGRDWHCGRPATRPRGSAALFRALRQLGVQPAPEGWRRDRHRRGRRHRVHRGAVVTVDDAYLPATLHPCHRYGDG